MVHFLEVESIPAVEWGYPRDPRALMRVDGRPLVDIIQDIEAPLAAADGEPSRAGQYDYLAAVDVLFPSRELLGVADRSPLDRDDEVPVLGCVCGTPDCWPLLMRIRVTEESVLWSEPRQPWRDHWQYPPGWHLVFDRRQYERALGFPA